MTYGWFFSFWHRIQPDFWPLDRSFVGPNLVADGVHWLIIGAVAYLVWPRFHRTVDAWVRRHLHNHHLLHVAPHHDAMAEAVAGLHQKLDHLLHLIQPKEIPVGIVQDVEAEIEARFGHHPATDPAVSTSHDLTTAKFIEFAKALAELTPEGREASLVLTKLEEAADWAHKAISRNQAVVVAKAAAMAEKPAEAVSPPVVPAPAPVPDVAGADVVVQPVPVTAAPAADPAVATPPVAPASPASTDSAPAAPAAPAV